MKKILTHKKKPEKEYLNFSNTIVKLCSWEPNKRKYFACSYLSDFDLSRIAQSNRKIKILKRLSGNRYYAEVF